MSLILARVPIVLIALLVCSSSEDERSWHYGYDRLGRLVSADMGDLISGRDPSPEEIERFAKEVDRKFGSGLKNSD